MICSLGPKYSASTCGCTPPTGKSSRLVQTNAYYPADFTWNGQTAYNVGIRSRGRGSRNSRKPGLRVDFNYCSTDGKFLGLKSLVLDNVLQDASGVHESVSMAFYARLGIPAPRELHARLYIRGDADQAGEPDTD